MSQVAGLPDSARDGVAAALAKVLADTYTLYLKTHGFHWNVTGPLFSTLHAMFEEQYREMWAATDEIAERIRALDVFAPSSYARFLELARVKEEPGVPDAKSMLAQLVEGHEQVSATIREAIAAAQEAEDPVSEDMMIGRLTYHDKTAWMLRSLMKDDYPAN